MQWTIDDVTSPCIGSGNPGSEPNDSNNVRIEIGAYGGTKEESKAPSGYALLADLNNDGIVNFIDYAAQQVWQIPDINEQPWDFEKVWEAHVDALPTLRRNPEPTPAELVEHVVAALKQQRSDAVKLASARQKHYV